MPTPFFKPGQSGNPKGRTPGKTPAAALRKAIAKEIPAILAIVIAQAKAGDMNAAKILIDKIIPTLKPQSLPVEIELGKDAVESGDNIITAILSGEIAPDVGSMLVKTLADQSKLVEMLDISKRVEVLESNAIRK